MIKPDLISKDKALEKLFNLTRKITDDRNNAYMNGYRDAFTDCYNAIEDVPGEEVSDEWIPCDARLPHDSKNVLCCNKTGRIMIGYIGLYEMGERKTYIAESEHDYMNDVIAWCPLPEPYGEK